MNKELIANFVSLDADGHSLIFAFAADDSGADGYVMFQHAIKLDGGPAVQNGLYIECDDQSKGCYGGVVSVRHIGEQLEIHLNETGRQRLQVERVLITPRPWSPIITRGLARLAGLSRGEYTVER